MIIHIIPINLINTTRIKLVNYHIVTYLKKQREKFGIICKLQNIIIKRDEH